MCVLPPDDESFFYVTRNVYFDLNQNFDYLLRGSKKYFEEFNNNKGQVKELRGEKVKLGPDVINKSFT